MSDKSCSKFNKCGDQIFFSRKGVVRLKGGLFRKAGFFLKYEISAPVLLVENINI